MLTCPPELCPRDATLWRVGRNFQCFQRIETQLKSLLPVLSLSGTHQQIEKQVRRNKRAVKKTTLGPLTDVYTKHVLTPKPDSPEPDVGSEVHFSFSMSVDATPEALEAMRADWKRMTAERNELVHSGLLANGLESDAEYVAFSQLLDEQFDHAQVLLSRLTQQAKARHIAASVFTTLLESGQLENWLQFPPGDA